MKFSTASSFVASLLLAGTALAGSGQIELPQPGTVINPGQTFNFSYSIRGDYCVSSYAFSVYLISDVPESFTDSDVYSAGYYFGRYDAENYPAVPYPQNPAPPSFVMPDFSKSQGGFGAGRSASNQTLQFTVMEEWDDCDTTVSGRSAIGTS